MKFLAVVFGAFLVNEALGCATCGTPGAIHDDVDYKEVRKDVREIRRDDRKEAREDWRDDRKDDRRDDREDDLRIRRIEEPKPAGCAKVRLVEYDVKLKPRKEEEQNKYVIISEGKRRDYEDRKDHPDHPEWSHEGGRRDEDREDRGVKRGFEEDKDAQGRPWVNRDKPEWKPQPKPILIKPAVRPIIHVKPAAKPDCGCK